MKALTLIDDNAKNSTPWAWLMLAGIKTIETRSWPVPSTIPMLFDLLICASASSRTKNKGMAICVVEVFDCKKMHASHEVKACCEVYHPGFSWFTRNLRWLSEPVPVKGRQGVFDFDLPAGITLYTPTIEQIEKERKQLKQAYNI